jgi:argininosuccinate lyase
MRERGLNYRDAHRVVGLGVRLALESGLPLHRVDTKLIDEAARATLGRPLDLDPTLVASAVDAAAVVASREGLGGAAAPSVRRMIGECRTRFAAAETRHAAAAARLQAAEETLLTRAAALGRGQAINGTRPTQREN